MTMRTGVRLRALLARRLDAATMERFIDPVLADLQSEYEDAVRTGRRWHSRRIWIAGHIAFCKVLAWHGVTRGTVGLIGVGDERRVMSRTLVAWILFTAVAAALFITPRLVKLDQAGNPDVARLALLLVPQALTAVIPFSLMCGILWGLGRAPAARRLRGRVLLLATMASLGMFVTWGWVTPASNQGDRVILFETVSRGAGYVVTLPKGLNELTLTEFRQIMEPPADWGDFVSEDARRFAFAPPVSRDDIVRQYHLRMAFAWSPLVLASFALALTARRERSRWWLGAAGGAAIVAYVVLTQSSARVGFGGSLPVALAAWVPNTAFLLMSIVISMTTRRAAS